MSSDPSTPPPPSDAVEDISRRAFVRILAASAGAVYAAAIGYPVYRYLSSPAEKSRQAGAVREVSLDGADTLKPGSVLMFKFGSQPAMLIHHADGTWVSLSAVCTHLGCTVQYEADQNRIHCACHGGVYDAHTGKNVSGPPPKPLPAYSVKVGNGSVVVSRGT
jgi:cytochrome b6-f complex iron-sulfur subunit